ncbi:uncharacterized protein BDV17DRAFT_111529 [Aspergillus undulatus]|uniref:uncharacterized protein n=1 Tax=Aspergillus undulatus TaxID=1810928 RepID=UPI003CCDC4E6
MMPFEFIDNNSAIDRAARRRIRTHAATAKNANRILTRPSKVTALKANIATPFRTPAAIRKLREDSAADGEMFEIERPVSDGLQFPVPVPARSRRTVMEALFFFCNVRFAPELDDALESPDVVSSIWVRYFFVDEAFFHCSIATSILCSGSFTSETAQAMHHIARTYRIIQERLMSSTEATSDMTIAILVAMSQYERLQRQYARGYFHVQGLCRMVQLRGGAKQFKTPWSGVIQKVLRADLEYALQLGGRPLLGAEGIEFLRSSKCLCIDDERRLDASTIPEVDTFLQMRLRADLWTIFTNVRHFAVLLNDAGIGYSKKLGAGEFHNTILLFGHCLLRFGPLGSSSGHGWCLLSAMSALEDVIHLGLIAFLVTFLPGLNHHIADQPLLSQRLLFAVQKLSQIVGAGEASRIEKKILLWAVFIGAVAVFKPADNAWLKPLMNATIQVIGLSSWKSVKPVLVGFPWVDALHDRTGIMLCTSSKSNQVGFPTSTEVATNQS